MHILSKIYAKLSILFSKPKIEENIYDSSIFFGLLKSSDSVDIKCLLPDIDNKNTEEIVDIAEKYAEMLVFINTEHFNRSIFKILENHKSKKSNDYKKTMLIDNIIHFWDVYYNLESKKQYKKYSQTQPLIKPTEVFSVKH